MITFQQMVNLSAVIKVIGERKVELQQFTQSDPDYTIINEHIENLTKDLEDSIELLEVNERLNEDQYRLLVTEVDHFFDACEELGKFLPESENYPIRKLIYNTSDSLVSLVLLSLTEAQNLG